jgi:hypothetical protein
MVNGPVPDRFLDAIRHDPVVTLAIAQGILAERYRVDRDVASKLLAHRAGRAGLSVLDAARWLVAAGCLP